MNEQVKPDMVKHNRKKEELKVAHESILGNGKLKETAEDRALNTIEDEVLGKEDEEKLEEKRRKNREYQREYYRKTHNVPADHYREEHQSKLLIKEDEDGTRRAEITETIDDDELIAGTQEVKNEDHKNIDDGNWFE